MAWILARLERHPEEIDVAVGRHSCDVLARVWHEHRQANGGENDG